MTASVASSDGAPNVLWICTDQQRFDTLGVAGNPAIRTPNLDRLAAEGVLFERAYVQSAICTPSRASFLTGCYPTRTHVHRNGSAEFPATLPLVTKLLADAGYDCGLVGKLHLSAAFGRVEQRPDDGYRVFEWSHKPGPESFWPGDTHAYQAWLREQGVAWDDVYRPAPDADPTVVRAANLPVGWGDPRVYPHLYRTGVPAEYHEVTWCVNETIEFISEGRHGPWLMSVNPFAPHPPLDPPPEYLDRVDRDRLPLPRFAPHERESQARFAESVDFQTTVPLHPDEYDARGMVAAYYAEIELIDHEVGRLLDALETTGQRERTIVVFHSDHGELLGDHGLMLKGCRFYEGLVHVPLIVTWPGGIPGGQRCDELVELVDIAPTLLAAAGVPVPEHVQGQSLLPLTSGDVSGRKSLARCEYHDALDLPHHSHATMLFDGRHKLAVYHGLERGELFDLDDDPDEFINRWDDPAHASARDRLMRAAFDEAMTSVDLGGPRAGRY